MNNPYQAPQAAVADIAFAGDNNSGGGKDITLPAGVKGWSWGAFFLNWIWSCFNKTWIGLLALVPYVGIVMAIYLGIKGRELAWRNKRWDNMEHFNRVQRKWSMWALIIVLVPATLGIAAAIMIPVFMARGA